MIIDDETVLRDHHRPNDPRASVTVYDDRYPFLIVLYFIALDAEAEFVAVEFDARGYDEELLPGRRLVQQADVFLPRRSDVDVDAAARASANLDLFVQYARAAILLDASSDFHPRRDEIEREAIAILRQLGRTRRGLVQTFYRIVADWCAETSFEHPVTELARWQGVNISTASRWIKEAERLGYVEKALKAREARDEWEWQQAHAQKGDDA